jgi:glycosyltransferase involved in cell wall biosynthesis
MRRLLAGLHHRLALRLFGESRRTFAELPPITNAGASAERAMRVLELRPDLRDVFPFALCPPDRGRLLDWWRKELPFGASADDCLALLHEMDARPDRGLARMYRLQPSWQEAVPGALFEGGPSRRDGQPLSVPAGRTYSNLKSHLVTRYRMPARWLKSAELPPGELEPPVDPRRGVNVVAHLGYPSGLQQAALGLLDALRIAGIPTSLRSLPVTVDDTPPPGHLGLEPYDTTIYLAAVNSFPDEWYGRAGLWLRPGVRRIAVWYWETEEVPAEWVPKLQWPDEVWAPTRFLADAFRKVVRVPVVPMLPGVELPPFAPLPRSRFGLRDDRFVFLFTFDMNSTMARKNPLGLIAAFRQAFAPHEPVDLVVKVSRGEADPVAFARLRDACADAGVRLLNETMPRAEVLALFAACDCYASLHRAEGFGLGMAEAMLLGKPVIATDYSGNRDFTTPETSYLVRCRRATCDTATGPYPAGAVWADPDLDHAAELLRRVFDHRDDARAVAERGRRAVSEALSMTAYAGRVAARLNGSR